VIRQDQVRLVADDQAVADVDAEPGQHVDFGEQRRRVDDDAVADDASDAVVQDARGDEMQDVLLPAHVDRVAGVVAALIAGHHVEARRHQIDDLALAFIAPLGAQHCDVHEAPILAARGPSAAAFDARQGRRAGVAPPGEVKKKRSAG
jgi:hypothetical protein